MSIFQNSSCKKQMLKNQIFAQIFYEKIFSSSKKFLVVETSWWLENMTTNYGFAWTLRIWKPYISILHQKSCRVTWSERKQRLESSLLKVWFNLTTNGIIWQWKLEKINNFLPFLSIIMDHNENVLYMDWILLGAS